MVTRISWDLGTLVHFLWGLAGGILAPWLFTAVFIFKQALDHFRGEEDWAETSGDIAEFCGGLLLGLALAHLLGA